ncbi:MAG: MarR family winged helix-turn-helix transcriptional regulator [Actinomycetota bacterium]
MSSVSTHSDQAGLAGGMRNAVLRLARRLRTEREDPSLTLTQLSTLGTLLRRGPVTLGELAAAEQVQPPTMTRVVSDLEERGLVAREPDEKDRRLVIVRLTREGEALLAADRERRDAWLNQRLRELTADERAVLRQAVPLLEKLAGS